MKNKIEETKDIKIDINRAEADKLADLLTEYIESLEDIERIDTWIDLWRKFRDFMNEIEDKEEVNATTTDKSGSLMTFTV